MSTRVSRQVPSSGSLAALLFWADGRRYELHAFHFAAERKSWRGLTQRTT
jgi:hypothetical protein